MPKNIDVRIGAEALPITNPDQEKFVDLLDELDPIIRRHGFDCYMLTVHNPAASEGRLITTALGIENSSQATDLLDNAMLNVQELIQSEREIPTMTPTAPGGIA